ncbi:MAG TPA: MarR family transcriptional regulator [Gammaproteobacteria bacterium]|nr:MarR family transcriptional regulator [Gammaproteobacteria bacterium]
MDTAKLADQTPTSEALWIPAEYRLIASWRTALRQFFSASKVILKERGVTSMQYQTLLAIRTSEDPEGINMNGLAAYLGVRHNSAVGLINRLEGSGLVRRERSERDRRVAHLKLTPEGETCLKVLVEAHRQELLNIRSEMRRIFK